MIAIAPTARPPANRPCSARKPISCVMFCAAPLSAEPTRKPTIDVRKMPFRPYMSPSLPHSGVETEVPSTYAVTTQERCDRPPRSRTIVGIAVPTMKLSSIARRKASSSAGSTYMTSRLRPEALTGGDSARSVDIGALPLIFRMRAYLPTG